jgi:hypothetical protein
MVVMKQDIHFALLVIGDLGEMGNLSLKSITDLGYQNIHVMADQPGKEWIINQAEQIRLFPKLYDLPNDIAYRLSQFHTDNYSEFGNSKFFQLMYLKWILIVEVLKATPKGCFVVFSDLDVLWSNSIEDGLENYFSNSRVNMAGQLDWNTKSIESKKYLCPGIMIWKNSNSSISMIEDIRGFHEIKLLKDKDFPDDKAINSWMQIDQNHEKIIFLSPHEFIIGHRLIALLAETSHFRLKNFKAFHANYCLGAVRKRFRIKILILVSKFPSLRFFAAGLILADIAIVKLRQTSLKIFKH